MERGDRVACFSTVTIYRFIIGRSKSFPGPPDYTIHHIPNAAGASRDATDEVGTCSAQATRHDCNGRTRPAAAG